MNKGLEKIADMNYPHFPGPYVISESLWHSMQGSYFAKIMQDYLGIIPNNSNIINNYRIDEKILSIEEALHFLDLVSQNEAKKEAEFIDWFNKTTGITPPSSAEDWKNFIQEFQTLLNNGQKDLTMLQNELNRLKENKNAIIKTSTSKQGIEYSFAKRKILSQWEYVGQRLEAVVSFLNGDNNNVGKEIVNFILEKYGNKLINIKQNGANIEVELNQSEVAGAILGISQLLLDKFYTKKLFNHFNDIDDFNNRIDRGIFKSQMKEILKDDKTLNNNILTLLENIKELPLLSNNIIKNYKLSETPTNIKLNLNFIDKDKNITSKGLQEILSYIKELDFQPTITFIGKSANIAELAAPIKMAAEGAIIAMNSGDTGAKSDNIIGWVKIEPNINQKTLITDISKIQNKIKELTDGLKKDNTEEYYDKREKDWEKAINEIDNIIQDVNINYEKISKCFIMEESTKGYTNMGIQDEIKGKTVFHGGSLGANIDAQIRKISALQNHGLISIEDADWLITAAINVGEGLILKNQKGSLENYLSTFATILLFDDQRAIANEVADQMKYNVPLSSSGNTNVIHLFTLNTGVYPLSYVLRLTYNKLVQVYGLVTEKAYENYGAQVNITGFINPDKKYPPGQLNNMTLESWEEISQEALKSVHMEIEFVTNFISLLNNILSDN